MMLIIVIVLQLLLLKLFLQLVPAYRAYTVDSLKKLSFLDDLPVTVDERLEYNGVSTDSGQSVSCHCFN